MPSSSSRASSAGRRARSTEAGPAREHQAGRVRAARISSGGVSWATTAEKTRHSRIRRAMSWLYWAPKSTTSTPPGAAAASAGSRAACVRGVGAEAGQAADPPGGAPRTLPPRYRQLAAALGARQRSWPGPPRARLEGAVADQQVGARTAEDQVTPRPAPDGQRLGGPRAPVGRDRCRCPGRCMSRPPAPTDHAASPPRDAMTSARRVPRRTSSRGVPAIVAGRPAQRARVAAVGAAAAMPGVRAVAGAAVRRGASPLPRTSRRKTSVQPSPSAADRSSAADEIGHVAPG